MIFELAIVPNVALSLRLRKCLVSCPNTKIRPTQRLVKIFSVKPKHHVAYVPHVALYDLVGNLVRSWPDLCPSCCLIRTCWKSLVLSPNTKIRAWLASLVHQSAFVPSVVWHMLDVEAYVCCLLSWFSLGLWTHRDTATTFGVKPGPQDTGMLLIIECEVVLVAFLVVWFLTITLPLSL